jgi:hypothetical protein
MTRLMQQLIIIVAKLRKPIKISAITTHPSFVSFRIYLFIYLFSFLLYLFLFRWVVSKLKVQHHRKKRSHPAGSILNSDFFIYFGITAMNIILLLFQRGGTG